MLRNTNVNTNPLPPLGIERFTISNYLIIISLLIAGNIVITETWSYSIVLITCLIIYQVNKWYKNLSEEEHTSNTLIIFILTLPLLATTIIYPLYFSAFKYYYEGTITPIRCYLSGCSFFSSLTEPLSMTKFNNNGFAALLLTFILILISSYILYKGIKLTVSNDYCKQNQDFLQ